MDLIEVSPNTNRHPWEMSRADFLLSVLKDHSKLGESSELLDVGAGDLFFSEKVNRKTGVRIDAVDNAFDDEASRNEAIRKIKELNLVQHKKYDAICALDVLEHVENDGEFLNLLLDMLKPGAAIIISVPAFNFLFSSHDFNLKHFRRYRISEVKALISNPEEFSFDERFYFFHSLFFVRSIEKAVNSVKTIIAKINAKFGNNKSNSDSFKSINQWQFAEHHPFTSSLGTMLTLDAKICRFLAKLKIRLPGLSLCIVIERKSNLLEQ